MYEYIHIYDLEIRHLKGLQYDGRPDWRFGVQVGMWKIGILSGKGEMFVKN